MQEHFCSNLKAMPTLMLIAQKANTPAILCMKSKVMQHWGGAHTEVNHGTMQLKPFMHLLSPALWPLGLRMTDALH